MIDIIRDSLNLSQRADKFYPSSKNLSIALDSSPYINDIVSYIETNKGNVRRDLLRWPKNRGGTLTDIGIIRHMLSGNIVINPFHIKQLESTGYALRISNIFFRLKNAKELDKDNASRIVSDSQKRQIYDAYSQKYLDIVWKGPVDMLSGAKILEAQYNAMKAGVIDSGDRSKNPFFNIEHDDEIIIIDPNEMVLGCTEEAGGGLNVVTTLIGGKSSTGRHGYEICSDAFLGEPGFVYPWVLEVANKHPETAIYLKKSTLVATMVFCELTEPPLRQYQGQYSGQGTNSQNLRALLPKPLKYK